MGVDLSPIALNLAQRNLEHNIGLDVLDRRAREEIQFHRGDVLRRNGIANPSTGTSTNGDAIPTVEELLSQHTTQSERDSKSSDGSPLPKIDLLISNPPYISHSDFHNGTTSRSVRLFEPRLALVPRPDTNIDTNAISQEGDKPEDIFYRRILELAQDVQASLTILECGDKMQAERVVEMFQGISPALGDGAETGGVFTAEVWPATEEDCLANGFHVRDGSRCVIIRKGGC
jgi:methylase of polypeptide subunit release factors